MPSKKWRSQANKKQGHANTKGDKKKFKNAEGRPKNLPFFGKKGVENWKQMKNGEEASAPPPKTMETPRETLEYASENRLFWFFQFKDRESFEGQEAKEEEILRGRKGSIWFMKLLRMCKEEENEPRVVRGQFHTCFFDYSFFGEFGCPNFPII